MILLDYPTQKPVALLERIIQESSNEGDVVLDPFCGCGTTIAEAQELNRQWIGIDITHLSVGLMKLRLKDSFGPLPFGEKGATSESLNGTRTIAQGKAEGRNPGNDHQPLHDPEGVEQMAADVAPLQGAEDWAEVPRGFTTGYYLRHLRRQEAFTASSALLGHRRCKNELAEKGKYPFQ